MNDRTLIFSSVMSRLLESLSHFVHAAQNEFEKENPDQSKIDNFDKFFERFPRHNSRYKSIINQLCKMASSDIDNNIHYITKLMKEVINGNSKSQFTLLQMVVSFYDLSNKNSFVLFYYFSLFFFTDLICQIVVNYGSGDSSTFLTRTAYNIAIAKHSLPKTALVILKQWAVIFSVLSEKDFSEVTQVFNMFSNSSDLSIPLTLMKYLRFDLNDTPGSLFFESLLQNIRNHVKKKTITNIGLESLSSMLITLPYNEEIYQKLAQIIKPLKYDKVLWSGATKLLTAIYLRLPNKRTRSRFYQKFVYGIAGDDKKLGVSLEVFEMMIIGRNTDVSWEYWEWGDNPRSSKHSFLRLNSSLELGQDDARSFTSIFMQTYFVKSDFSLYPKLIKKIMLHLASLDFLYFTNNIAPHFLDLNDNDSRFISLLMIVPKVNSDDFRINCFKKIPNHELILNKFNKSLKEKVSRALKLCVATTQSSKSKHRICFSNYDILLDNLTSEANQKLIIILDEWKMRNDFKEMENKLHYSSELCKNTFSLEVYLIPALVYIFDDNDFNNPILMDTLIEFSFNDNQKIALSAYNICRNVLSNLPNQENYMQILALAAASDDYEIVYTCLSLLEASLHAIHEVNTNLLHDIEVMAFLGLAAIDPNARHLCLIMLQRINDLLKSRGLLSCMNNKVPIIEKNAKDHILLKNIPDEPEKDIFPASIISLETAILSQYYEIWIYFIAAIMNQIIEVNYEPFFQRLSILTPSLTPILCNENRNVRDNDLSILIILLSSMFHSTTIDSSRRDIDKSQQYAPYSDKTDKRKEVCKTLNILLSSDSKEMTELGFNTIPFLHFSILGPIIDVLSNVQQSKIPQAIKTLCNLLRQPEINQNFIMHNFRRITSFISTANSFLLEKKLNSPRVIDWNQENEQKLNEISDMACSYCIIITIIVDACDIISDHDWAMNTRELVLRFLINWAITQSEKHKVLRKYAKNALSALVKGGTIFTDGLLFDDIAVEFLGQIEIEGTHLLTDILYFHIEFLLDYYIKACYTQPPRISDAYFTAICNNLKRKHGDVLLLQSGQLILLLQVFSQHDHPLISKFLHQLLKIAYEHQIIPDDNINIDPTMALLLIPQMCEFATEAVFNAFYIVLQYQRISLPFKEIINSVRMWMPHIRLLPKQSSCVQNIPPVFHYFTPYEFLMALNQATNDADDDRFRVISGLWNDLVVSPDNREIVTIFLSNLANSNNLRIYSLILYSAPEEIIFRVDERGSFAYYYHCTKCLGQPYFLNNDMVGVFLKKLLSKIWDSTFERLPITLLFIILFRENGTKVPFQFVCKKFDVQLPEGQLSNEASKELISQIINKLKNYNVNIEDIGNEALKWTFGCENTEIAANALMIYNRILKPYNEKILPNQIIKTVSYHFEKLNNENKNNFSHLALLVSESFYFFNHTLDHNDNDSVKLVFNYITSFLDCQIVLDIELHDAIDFFMKSLKKPDILILISQNIISLIRPLIPMLETSKSAQELIDYCILIFQSEEIMLIAAPLKKLHPHLFPHLPNFEDFIHNINENAMCTSLIHYAIISENASRPVLNSIFEITTLIVSKIVNENNKQPLTKLYQIALRSMNRCPAAYDFVQILCEKQPQVASTNIIDFYEWSRTFNDVNRSIKLLIKNCIIPVTNFTDCKSYTSVLHFLYDENLKVKIMPFASQQDMIEGMKKIEGIKKSKVRKGKKKGKLNKNKARGAITLNSPSFSSSPSKGLLTSTSTPNNLAAIPTSVSVVFSSNGTAVDIISNLTPLRHPKRIITDSEKLVINRSKAIILTPKDYLGSLRRKSFNTGSYELSE
ncbi:hypothetical protein TRFO_31800 [Tritrichomonas foetus]|uniref:Uncharacterized protein n=1 Tax=Tritrichomonas foetus TaxID=1144522 RepID=A0A1J4JQM4_9EUKA|nr:hypothetical protein TRFO_31800 [Tritrichomonas foetus]|eukprot:OHT01417.1 hypothetical protein TRFO_31800 [Tritrichomonas foetus]